VPGGDSDDELARLELRRDDLLAELAQVGDFRRGSLSAVFRKCGKPNCACAAPGHRGHGPQWNLTRKVGGRTVAVHLKPGPELDKARREVAEYKRFRALADQVAEVSEQISRLRPVLPGGDGAEAPSWTEGGKGGSGRRSPGRGPPSWGSSPPRRHGRWAAPAPRSGRRRSCCATGC
jgi:uncharacterized protein DUF6788